MGSLRADYGYEKKVMKKVYLCLLFIVGAINFVPVLAVVSLEQINHSYGLSVTDNNLAILLRHRALLFGVLGGFVLFSVFKPQYQVVAMVLAMISMLGYLIVFYLVGDVNAQLLAIAKVDIVGVVLLFIAALIKLFILR